MKPIHQLIFVLTGLLVTTLASSNNLRGQPMFGVMGQASESVIWR
jgi:hypothetical protein